jgi:predicted metal-dependent HD superfamily phosphohydrolase
LENNKKWHTFQILSKEKSSYFLDMHYPESLQRISDLANQRWLTQTDDRLFFHNMTHTIRLLDAVKKMSAHYVLDERNHLIVCAAAWLHDLEMIASGSAFRELTTTAFSEELLRTASIDEELIGEIKKSLMATQMGASPVSLNEKIICDACSFHIGSPNFPVYNQLLRKETEAFTQEKFKGSDWRTRTISEFDTHLFHTEYCQTLLNKSKEFNLQSIVRIQEEKNWQNNLHPGHQKQKKTDRDRSVVHHPAWKNKSRHHLSGVETVFRNSSSNHLNLSVMADNKAFIMISVNSILISVGIGLIIGKFVLVPKLFFPTLLLLSVNVFTIIYSVLATRPGRMKGLFTREGVDNKTVDLLFFGNFFKMPLVDFEYGMRKMMDDDDFLYGNLIRDIYAQGKTLGRKFRLLRTSYNIFMYGTAFTVLAYIVSFFI